MKIFLNMNGRGRGGPQVWASRFRSALEGRGYGVTHDIRKKYAAALFSIGTDGMESVQRRRRRAVYRVAGCYLPEWFEAMGMTMQPEHHAVNEGVRHGLEHADCVVYQSRWAKKQLDEVLYRRESDYVIVHNGVNTRAFSPGPADSADGEVLGVVGEFRFEYQLRTVFEACRLLGGSTRVVAVGSPNSEELEDCLERYAHDPDLKQRIRHISRVPPEELPALYRRMTVLLHPVAGDSCPNVVVEALACGVPVVCPAFGGTSELVGDGGEIFDCAPWKYDDEFIRAMSEAAQRVLTNRREYSERARQRATNVLDIGPMTDQYLEAMGLPARAPKRSVISNWFAPATDKRRARVSRNGAADQPGTVRSGDNGTGRLKIGFAFHDLAMGGAQCFFIDLMKGLARRGHELFYHLYSGTENPVLCNPRLYARLCRVATPRVPRGLRRCDVVHLDGHNTPEEKKSFRKILGCCVETYHSAYSAEVAGPDYGGFRISISREVARALPLPSRIIYYGIDADLFRPHPRVRKGFDIGVLGRIHPTKNQLLFLDICEELSRIRQGVSAKIIGGGSDSLKYTHQVLDRARRIRQSGVRMEVTGFIAPSEVAPHLASCRLLIVPSESEGFGRMACEALACGVPVISRPRGGIDEVVEEGKTGIFVPGGNAEAVAREAAKLLNEPSRIDEMGKKGIEQTARRFSMEKMVDDYEEVYQLAAAERKANGSVLSRILQGRFATARPSPRNG